MCVCVCIYILATSKEGTRTPYGKSNEPVTLHRSRWRPGLRRSSAEFMGDSAPFCQGKLVQLGVS